MTYKAPDKVPYDEWFDPDYKFEPHPYDSWPMAKENPRPEEEVADDISMHEKMYRLAVQKHSPWKGGGSENFCHGGGSEEWQDSKPG